MQITLNAVTQRMLEHYEQELAELAAEAVLEQSAAYFNRITLISAIKADIMDADVNGDMEDCEPWEIRKAVIELRDWIAACKEPPDPS